MIERLDQLLNLTRPLFVIDAETTGIDPQRDRIVELGFQQWTAAGMVKEWRTRINPGIPIPEASVRVHHITDADVKDHVTFAQLAQNLARGFSNCDYAGKHVRYDLQITDAEFQRAGVPWTYAGAYIIDADRLEALAEPRSLSHLYKKYTGDDHLDAHGALGDVKATAVVIAGQLTRYESLPRDLKRLHEMSWPGWLCNSNHFRMVDGVATCGFGKHKGKAMRDIEPSYWAWIASSDFPADVKRLAEEAKMGRFP